MAGRKSIATRLFLWLFLAGLTALLAGGGLLYHQIRTIILSSLDHTLESDVEIFSRLLHEEDGGLEFEYQEATAGHYVRPHSGHYYEIFTQGKLFASSPSLAGKRIELASATLERKTGLQRVYTAIGPGSEPLRALEKSLVVDGHPATVVVAHTLEESREMLQRFRNFLLLFGGAAVLLIAAIGLLITDRVLRPLRTFSDAVRRTTEKTLDRQMDAENQYREFGALAASFNEMLARLRTSFAAREHLLSDVSHELKTPVAVIRSHCDIYLQKTRTAGEYVDALAIIRETADAMALKIRRLLSLAEVEADLLAAEGFRPVPIDECLRKAVLTIEPLARERLIRIEVSIHSGLIVSGHEERLIEAFSNLLENAIKYNREGGGVLIVAEAGTKRAQVRIEDTGQGIPAEDLPRIFDRFYRGTESRAEEEGTGLGLGIVKAIVEAHDGTIDVTSRPGEGSCFTILLPLLSPSSP